jgi:micrococcal nuclease
LAQFLQRRGRRRTLAAILIPLVLGLLSWLDHRGHLIYGGSDLARYHDQTFAVARVVDGDTLHVQAPDGSRPTTVIRLWGIDTPEVARRRDGVDLPAQPFAEEAKALTRGLCEGKKVRLKLESHSTRDRYGRLLAHVELADGEVLNERLLTEGLARFEARFSHDRLSTYDRLEREAKRSRRGLWAEK